MSNNNNNPGTVLASAVDAEMKQLQAIEAEAQQFQLHLHTLMGQETENEMVHQELALVGSSSQIYKQIGPVLMKQDIEDAKQAVSRRLEFIRSEKSKVESKIEDAVKRRNELAKKIQKMQAGLQEATARAIQAISQEHQNQVK